MLGARLHALAGDAPGGVGVLDLAPAGTPGLGRADRRQHQEPQAQLRCAGGVAGRHPGERTGHPAIVQCPLVIADTRHRRQCGVNAVAGGVGRDVLVQRHRIGEDGADALAHPPGRLGLVVPDGVQHLEHVGAGDAVDRQIHQRLGVAVQRAEPLLGVARVAPAGRVEGMHCCRRVGEGRRGGDLVVAGRDVAGVGKEGPRPQLCGAQPGLVEADGGVGAQPDVAALAVGGDPGHPRAPARRLDHEREPAAVGVLARRCVLDVGCVESAWLCHVSASRVPRWTPRVPRRAP